MFPPDITLQRIGLVYHLTYTHIHLIYECKGLKNRKIGKHLTLHPVVAAATKLPAAPPPTSSPGEQQEQQEQFEGYRGVGMGVVVKNIEREEDKGWGSAIGTTLPLYILFLT